MPDSFQTAIYDLITEFSLKKDDACDCETLIISKEILLAVALRLRDDVFFAFDTLIDVCGVDYLEYGVSEWNAQRATHSGFSRAVQQQGHSKRDGHRFAVVYHLLSTRLNQRLRLKVSLSEDDLSVPSVCDIWPAANWFEREAFDLFGIVFDGHADLRRLLTDYGFKGHPFRKDFPLIGEVEMRYDATKQRCVYEPVSIQPRVLVPKVIRSDQRYSEMEEKG